MRRSSLSIPSNIAEGSGRWGNAERNHFLHIAKWSDMELQTQILLAQTFWYIDEEVKTEITELIGEIIKMIYSVIWK
jgi:four helix bundle protein